MAPESPTCVPVWDRVVRITHWSVAALVLWDLFEDSGGPLHRNLGYVAAALVALRLAWGVVGGVNARFATWWPRLSILRRYATSLRAGTPMKFASHNPIGALGMLAMWALIVALAVTGWLSRLDGLWGEDWPRDLHAWLAYTLAALVAVHISAAIVMSLLHKNNLILAMLTGKKKRHD
ncbi:cytochrome b/b6 domain-containing protein [Ralstonia sp. SET104]|uniref:cytochrome b/b6 domain-containing protein n=1 Tax=Ralstonia sp. SET104 TaxID=2448774 RepID=UPI000FFA21A4|nr:cytochrome b/b6 domain-containing protein [Ralstonia sp. SET104]GCB04184.1 cytochrome b561 [Ralstonia sp. SET104]